MSNYFKNIKDSFRTLSGGLKLTLGNLVDARTSRKPIGVKEDGYFDADKGIFTLQYPNESFPVPDNGRYRLHNEIDDCIVCDKCAKVCPVDCIEIEPIKATETIGLTSDGTPKRIHAAKFDIDMGKCCFCGLCTTVCPTECLTMTKVYDFSEFDVKDHNYAFAEMSLVEIAQKRKEAAELEKQKTEARIKLADEAKKAVVNKPEMPVIGKSKSSDDTQAKKPVFKPKMPAVKTKNESEEEKKGEEKPIKAKPVFRPKPIVRKPKITDTSESSASESKPNKGSDEEEKPAASKPKFRPRPIIRKKPKDEDDGS